MSNTLNALAAHQQPVAKPTSAEPVLLVGAGGALGSAVLRALCARGAVQVAITQPLLNAATDVVPVMLALAHAPVVVVVIDHAPHGKSREAALAQCAPDALLALAQRLHATGTHTLVVVTPHNELSLPAALQRGLLNLDERALAAVGFAHLALVRPARKAAPSASSGALQSVADRLFDTLKFMVPSQQQPVMHRKVAAFVEATVTALPRAAPGTHIAGAELVWQSAQAAQADAVVQAWLGIAVKTCAT
jgi:hypothetical protein